MKARKSPKQIMEELEAKKPKPPERIISYQTGGAENSPSTKSPPKSAPLKRPIIKSIETAPLIDPLPTKITGTIPADECNTDYDISILAELAIVNAHNQLNDPEAIPVTKEPIKRKRGRPPKNAPKLSDVEPPKEDDFISGMSDPINEDPLTEEQVLHKEINLKLPGINISNPVPRTGPSKLETFANFKWSQYIPKIPTTKQLAALMLEQEDELLYGGALGGGKSEWLAMECLRYCDIPNFAGIIFRRQLSDLKQPGSLIPRIASWLATFEAKGMCSYSGSDHRWTFKTTWPGTDIPGPPAFLQFGYIGEASVRERYQSAEFQRVCFEELGQWEDDVDYLFMFSRIRQVVCPIHGKDDKGEAIYNPTCPQCNALKVITPGMRAASNPGPAWIKRRFGIRPDPVEFPNPRSALIAIQEGKKVKWVGTPGFPKFIAAYLWDNPHLNEKSYRKLLAQMTEGERSRLEDGNWEARKNARLKRKYQRFVQLHVTEDYLKDYSELEHVYQPAKWEDFSYSHIQLDSQGYQLIGDPIPFVSFRKVYLTADPAVTAKRGPIDAENKQKNSYTGLGVFAETRDQELLWLSAMKFRKEIPDVIQSTTFLNEMWPIQYNKIEATGVGVTLAQFLESAGLNVTKNWKKTDKIENSMSSQMLLSKNRILFPINALWLEMVEDVIFNWTGLDAEEDDMVDVLSDASNDLSLKIASQLVDHKVHRSLPSTSGGFKGKFQIPRYGLKQ